MKRRTLKVNHYDVILSGRIIRARIGATSKQQYYVTILGVNAPNVAWLELRDTRGDVRTCAVYNSSGVPPRATRSETDDRKITERTTSPPCTHLGNHHSYQQSLALTLPP